MNGEQIMTAWAGRGDLRSLVSELERQRDSRVDVVLDQRHVEVVAGPSGGLVLRPKSHSGPNPVTEWIDSAGIPVGGSALTQLGSRQDIPVPSQFLQAMAAGRPGQAAALLNGFLDDGRQAFVRCLDGRVRAWLSSQYRVIEHYDLAFAALDEVSKHDGQVIECALSDRSMRIKFVSRGVWETIDEKRRTGGPSHEWIKATGFPGGVATDDGETRIHPVCTIRNSETGHGGCDVQFGIIREACVNLAIMETTYRQVHLGSKMDAGFWKPETRRQADKALVMQLADSIAACFHPARLRAAVQEIKGGQSQEIKNPTTAVDNLAMHYRLTDERKASILTHFLRDYDPNAYGLGQAVARVAQDVDDETAEMLESAAGAVMRGKHRALVAV